MKLFKILEEMNLNKKEQININKLITLELIDTVYDKFPGIFGLRFEFNFKRTEDDLLFTYKKTIDLKSFLEAIEEDLPNLNKNVRIIFDSILDLSEFKKGEVVIEKKDDSNDSTTITIHMELANSDKVLNDTTELVNLLKKEKLTSIPDVLKVPKPKKKDDTKDNKDEDSKNKQPVKKELKVEDINLMLNEFFRQSINNERKIKIWLSMYNEMVEEACTKVLPKLPKYKKKNKKEKDKK